MLDDLLWSNALLDTRWGSSGVSSYDMVSWQDHAFEKVREVHLLHLLCSHHCVRPGLTCLQELNQYTCMLAICLMPTLVLRPYSFLRRRGFR